MTLGIADQRMVSAPDDGARLDAFVHAQGPGLSRRDARRLCEAGGVALAGVRATASARLCTGDLVAWRHETVTATLRLGLSVVCLDEEVLVVEKPAHLAAHAGPLVDDSVAARIERAFPGAGLAHRLDRGASGLLLLGRTKDALRALAAAMADGAIDREYVAIVHGEVVDDAFTIDLPLRATDEPRGDRPKVVIDREDGQPARTHVRQLDRRGGNSLLAVRLETGRTHQIRAHLAAVGHALLGDPRYGDATANARARATWGIDRPLLHAVRLRLPHPRNSEIVELWAWHEADFARMFRTLGEHPHRSA